MSNRKRLAPNMVKKTMTTDPEGITITPPAAEGPTRKHYVGADHAPTEEEALEMGRALFDAIQVDVAKNARAVQ